MPYSRHTIDDGDLEAVRFALRAERITQGPKVEEFEARLAASCGARYAVAVSSGTAALHLACQVAGVGPGDEGITTPLTFVASANALLYCGARPVFADVEDDTLTLNPRAVAKRLTRKTKAIVTVDLAGHPCEYDEILRLARRRRLAVIADATHALGASYRGRQVSAIADLTVFSFHPVKAITTGEGGAILTHRRAWAERLRALRSHGIVKSAAATQRHGPWFYEMRELGMNYRITDFQCALGLSQLEKLPRWIERRRAIANAYTLRLREVKGLRLPLEQEGVSSAFHLYQVRVDRRIRRRVVEQLQERGIQAQVHYIPVYWHPYYRKRFGFKHGLCPVAERAYTQLFTLPIYPGLADEEVDRVVRELAAVMRQGRHGAPTTLPAVVGTS